MTQTEDKADDILTFLGRLAKSWISFVVVLALGWIGVLVVNQFHFGPPVFFLWVSWLAILLVGRYLVVAAISAAFDNPDGTSDEDFWKPVGRHEELMHEKRSLLKAIKEIEFDHQMGKMSDADAREITRFYRDRAIAVIKALDQRNDDSRGGKSNGEMSIDERIEREVKARLTVAGAENKAGAVKRVEADKAKEAEPESQSSKEDAESSSGAEVQP